MDNDTPLTYDQFVKRVVCEVAPLLPGALSPELEYAGSDVPDADAAPLHCGRALALEALARMTAHVTGADVHEYAHGRTLIRKEPVLLHAAYARNIRRWERGTLPRKRKARVDFVLVAVCWLYAWGDAECAFVGAHRAARERMIGWLAPHARCAGGGMAALVRELWHASSLAYRASLDARTDRGRGYL